jgi:aspartyl-tRNA(Asn)/glutamyl-tRNA(Gln) amidotransferase subunit A
VRISNAGKHLSMTSGTESIPCDASPDLWTVHAVADTVRAGRVSAEEVVQIALGRIRSSNGALNAFVHVDEGLAIENAREVDRLIADGRDPGPFAGVPIGVKDLQEHVSGMPTTDGSLLLKGEAALSDDSPHVALLRRAGAVIVGRTAAAEFGIDSATSTRAWGVTRNPWDTNRTPGGSSGGSAAAVAAAMVPFATASDTGGSIRSPASHTQLVGFKPTFGIVPQLDPESLLNSVGGLATTVRDAARHLDATVAPAVIERMTGARRSIELALQDARPPSLRVALSLDLGYIPVDDEIAEIVAAAYESLLDIAHLTPVRDSVVLSNPFMFYVVTAFDDLAARIEREFKGKRDLLCKGLGDSLEAFLGADDELLKAERVRGVALRGEIAKVFETCDLVVSPVTAVPPHIADGDTPVEHLGRSLNGIGVENFPMWANVGGCPSISIPAGKTRTGLPVGMMITGPRGADVEVLKTAWAWERARPWQRVADTWASIS